jgi:hypothetical protein
VTALMPLLALAGAAAVVRPLGRRRAGLTSSPLEDVASRS